MFEVAEAYERQRGRSSKLLAPLFAEFVGVQGEVLDVGCGTGALTFAIAKSESVSKIVAIDLSEAFLAYARFKTDDPRISFESGDAQHLSFPDASFDQCLALLVMRFIPDAPQAVKEMRRVTRPGGVVATAMWDTAGGNDLNDSLWEAALPFDANAPQDKDQPGSYGTAEELSSLWASARLENIEDRLRMRLRLVRGSLATSHRRPGSCWSLSPRHLRRSSNGGAQPATTECYWRSY